VASWDSPSIPPHHWSDSLTWPLPVPPSTIMVLGNMSSWFSTKQRTQGRNVPSSSRQQLLGVPSTGIRCCSLAFSSSWPVVCEQGQTSEAGNEVSKGKWYQRVNLMGVLSDCNIQSRGNPSTSGYYQHRPGYSPSHRSVKGTPCSRR
jgi:hypothetical protein